MPRRSAVEPINRKSVSICPTAIDGGQGEGGKRPKRIGSTLGPGLGKERSETTGAIVPKAGKKLWIRKKCGQLVNSWRFNLFTTVLTVYALFGDDCRLALTHQRSDMVFNGATIICLVVFIAEVIISSLGQEEYFMGFFFALDTGSTATLILDLTWIGNAIFCSSDSQSALRTSRTGKAGARAARTVRIIRLMRLVKLYKAYKTTVDRKKHLEAMRQKRETQHGRDSTASSLGPGEEGDEYSSYDDPDEQSMDGRPSGLGLEGEGHEVPPPGEKGQAESRVGKKLSDMTTRRVILLVLVMLFIMPMFTAASFGVEEFQLSSSIGSDTVYERWRTYCGTLSNNSAGAGDSLPWCLQSLTPPNSSLLDRRQDDRAWFEKALLNFLYQHHDGVFAWRLYWLGFNSTSLVKQAPQASHLDPELHAVEYLGQFAALNQARFLGNYTLPLDDWDPRFCNSKAIEPEAQWSVRPKPLLEEFKDRLTKPWTERCSSYSGVPVNDPPLGLSHGGCSTTEELRCSEREWTLPGRWSSDEMTDFSILFTFDIRATTTLEAGLSIFQTIFICFAVGLGAMSFSKDANELLLNPIERMIAKMESIKDNPLEAMRLGDLEYRREENEQARRKEHMSKMGRCQKLFYKWRSTKKVKEPMETVMLEKTIIKLGGLLALGFGEAGAEIIGHNMQSQPGGAGQHAGVNATVPGQKVDAIIGYCTIRDFALATHVLKEKVMLFVNKVGEIVHGCVDDYHGAPNKNIGEAFLVVWRLTGLTPERQAKLADMALMSFVKIVAELSKSRVLAVYRKHPGLLQRHPNFKVQMGCGMHSGWAVEGAIGSEYKVDAAYLSPNVGVASRIEAATKHYGVQLLISHCMVHLCSQDLAWHCRLIDHVEVRGARTAVRVYTVDLDHDALEVVTKPTEPVTRNRFKIRQLREVRKNEKLTDYCAWEQFTADEDLVAMRSKFSTEFFHRFSMAYRNYEAGEWMAARDMLFTCHYQPRPDVGRFIVTSEADWPEDGPTVTLLAFMKRFDFQPPADWPGFRELPLRVR